MAARISGSKGIFLCHARGTHDGLSNGAIVPDGLSERGTTRSLGVANEPYLYTHSNQKKEHTETLVITNSTTFLQHDSK